MSQELTPTTTTSSFNGFLPEQQQSTLIAEVFDVFTAFGALYYSSLLAPRSTLLGAAIFLGAKEQDWNIPECQTLFETKIVDQVLNPEKKGFFQELCNKLSNSDRTQETFDSRVAPLKNTALQALLILVLKSFKTGPERPSYFQSFSLIPSALLSGAASAKAVLKTATAYDVGRKVHAEIFYRFPELRHLL